MSLINQMLVDLERTRPKRYSASAGVAQINPEGIGALNPEEPILPKNSNFLQRPKSVASYVLVTALLAVLFLTFWKFYEENYGFITFDNFSSNSETPSHEQGTLEKVDIESSRIQSSESISLGSSTKPSLMISQNGLRSLGEGFNEIPTEKFGQPVVLSDFSIQKFPIDESVEGVMSSSPFKPRVASVRTEAIIKKGLSAKPLELTSAPISSAMKNPVDRTVGKENVPLQSSIKMPIEEIIKKRDKDRPGVSSKPLSAPAVEPLEDDIVLASKQVKPSGFKKKTNALLPQQISLINFQKAVDLLQLGKQDEAKKKLNEAISDAPKNSRARELLIVLQMKSGELTAAKKLLNNGITLDPKFITFYKLYAKLLLDEGNPKLARQLLEKAAPKVAFDSDTKSLLAAIYQKTGMFEKSSMIYRQLVRNQPKHGIWWMGYGLSLEGEGKGIQALDAFNRAKQSKSLNKHLSEFVQQRISKINSNLVRDSAA